MTPHVAGVTTLTYANMAHVVAEEVKRIHRGEKPSRQVNIT